MRVCESSVKRFPIQRLTLNNHSLGEAEIPASVFIGVYLWRNRACARG